MFWSHYRHISCYCNTNSALSPWLYGKNRTALENIGGWSMKAGTIFDDRRDVANKASNNIVRPRQSHAFINKVFPHFQ